MVQLSPFVYWAQSDNNVFLKVDLKQVKKPSIQFETRKVSFQAEGVGAHGSQIYTFNIDLQSDILPEKSNFKVQDSRTDISITKLVSGFWPRLTSQPQKPVWLKIDFDRWQSNDDAYDDTYDDEVRDINEDYPNIYENLQKEEMGYRVEDFKMVYLVFYNLFMFVGFMYVVIVMTIRYMRDGVNSYAGTYNAVGRIMGFVQMMQFLEIMHPLFKYTSGGILAPLLQVTGRAIVLFPLIDAEPRMQTKPVVFYLFMVWSLVEIFRYPYYISQLIKKENSLLTWLRYTIWIPLYPLGFICEAIVIFRSIPYLEETGRFSFTLPSPFNFQFYVPTLLRIYLLGFMIPLAYKLMSHMNKNRNKKLGKNKHHRQ